VCHINKEKLIFQVKELYTKGSRGIPSDWRGELAHGGGMLLKAGNILLKPLRI
jgi:hypothetical protein